MLAKLGFRFDPSELTDADVEAFRLIKGKLHELEIEEMKKGQKHGRHKS